MAMRCRLGSPVLSSWAGIPAGLFSASRWWSLCRIRSLIFSIRLFYLLVLDIDIRLLRRFEGRPRAQENPVEQINTEKDEYKFHNAGDSCRAAKLRFRHPF